MFQAKEEGPCRAAHATLALMRTLILDPTTASLDELLERRRRSGLVSPNDETWEKLPFYANHHVDEILIIDPSTRKIDWLTLHEGDYEPTEHSNLIEFGPHELSERIDWPRLSRSPWKFVAAIRCDGYTVMGMRVFWLLAV